MNLTKRLPTALARFERPTQPHLWVARGGVRVARGCAAVLVLLLAEFLAALCYVSLIPFLPFGTAGFLLTIPLGVGMMSVAPRAVSPVVRWLVGVRYPP